MPRLHAEPPDGGWGWIVAISGLLMHCFVLGLERASGVFYREILSEMQETSASTAGFSAILFASTFLCSPVAGVLCKYWSCRTVMMIGGVLACLGVMLSSFCCSMALIYLTLGLMTGIGNGLAYTSGLLAVNEYFNRRKATALGVATAGGGIGGFVMPLLIQHLIRVYSYRGCMMIVSGLSLNLVVCGALLYPLPPLSPATTETLTQKQSSSADSTCRRFLAQLWTGFDLKLFLNPYFSAISAAALCISAGFKPVAVLLPHHAQLSGLGVTASVLLVSITGASDTVSRFILGLLFDIPQLMLHRRRIWTLGMLPIAASIAAYAFMKSLAPFVLVSVTFGLASGLFLSQLYCVLGDLIGRERSRTGIGLLTLCRGIGVAIGPPVAGAIKDATGTYVLPLCALGIFVLFGFSFLCVLEVIVLRQRHPSAAETQEAIDDL